jgi:papain fold toxin 1 (glutamine deamidase) of polymorphic toxin system
LAGVLLGGDGDGESECLQLPDVVAGFAVGVDAAGVVAGAEFVVAGGGFGEQVPDDDQDGPGDRDECFEFAAAFDDPPVALAEEGVGPGRGGGDLAEDASEVGVALAGFPGPVAGDAKLSGNATSALDVGAQPISRLEDMFGGSFQSDSGQSEIESTLRGEGQGSRGIVFGSRGAGAVGHVWNAVNQSEVIGLDFQSGLGASFEGYKRFRF